MSDAYDPSFELNHINLFGARLEGTLKVSCGDEDEVEIPLSEEDQTRLYAVTDDIINEYLENLRGQLATAATE